VLLDQLEAGRATLGVEVGCLPDRVGVSLHSITGAEARIGIDAPVGQRVYRKELWLELLGANQAAADWQGEELSELLRGEVEQ